jgi:transglutaminase-like putative cysteine protease
MERDIVVETLGEWTKGLGPEESRIAVFSRIRDMPYEIIAELRDPYEGPAKTIKAGRGSCIPKHFLLGAMFELLDTPVQFVTYTFYWDDPDIAFPRDLRELAKRAPLEYHLAIKAHIDRRWVLVDATWDLPLKKAGYPVNESWDGISDTINAVKPLQEIVHASAVERDDYTSRIKGAFTEEETAAMEAFFAALNSWCRQLRGEQG